MSLPTVVAVIPHFAATNIQLSALVKQVLDQEGSVQSDVVVVANNPGNDAFKSVAGLPRVTVLEPGLNMGYVGALEWVRRRCSTDFLWVLQEDISPMPTCLERMINAFESTELNLRLAVASPIEVDSAGDPSNKNRSMNVDLDTGQSIPLTEIEKANQCEPIVWNGGRQLTFVFLSGAVIRQEALAEVGGFDVNLWPLQYVDVDACVALQLNGFAIKLVGDALIRHDRSAPHKYPKFHRWKELASTLNSRRMIDKYSGAKFEDNPKTSDIPPDILYSLSRSMSDFLFEYSEWVFKTSTSLRGFAWYTKRALGVIKRNLS